MPTDFLNRRMDLLHNRDNLVDTLTMDTSYPVRLAGKVIKIFTASYDYEIKYFNICNSEKETILVINTSNIYDFAGRVIMNSIGDGKAYPTKADVFKTGDYVMAIIDFDNNSMYLCSQTNFEKFITGNIDTGEKCKFKLFDITGDTKITFEDGETRSIDLDKFQEAIDFEAQEDDEYHSFLRCDNDSVIFENPSITTYTEKQNDIEVTISKYDMTPVSNVDNLNVNSINTSIQNFFFPIVNIANYTNPTAFDTIGGFRLFQLINGKVNQKFINDYCFTYQEIKNLPFYDKRYVSAEVNNFSSSEKDNYYYVLMCNNVDNDKYSTAVFKDGEEVKDENKNTISILPDNLRFTPIKKDTMKFASYMDSSGGNIKCGDTDVLLSARRDSGINHLFIGNWFSNDKNYGYTVWKFAGNIVQTAILVQSNGKTISNINITDYQYSYKQYYDTRKMVSDYVVTDNCNIVDCYNTTLMKYIKRFVEFFIPTDTQYGETYRNAIRAISISPQNASSSYPLGIMNDTSKSITPFCSIIIYPEIFESVLYERNSSTGEFAHTNENIKTFTKLYGNNDYKLKDTFNRTSCKTPRHTVDNYGENLFLVYSLFDLGKTNEKMYEKETLTTIELKWLKDEYKNNNMIYRANQTVLGNSNTNLICNIINTYEKDSNKKLMITHISKLKLTQLDSPYIEDESNKPDYNVAEIGHQNFIVARIVTMADNIITYDNGSYSITYRNVSCPLYVIVNDGSNNLSMQPLTKSNFKNTGSKTSNIMYLYFRQSNAIISVKYYYNTTDSSTEESKINSFDYISCATILTSLNKEKTEFKNLTTNFEKSLINAYINDGKTLADALSTYNSAVMNSEDGWMDQVIKCVKTYRLYPYNLSPIESPNVVISTSESNYIASTTNIYTAYNSIYHSKELSEIDSYYHENIYYGAWINSNNYNDGDGFRLKDMIGNDYGIYQNCMVPYVSNTVSANGSKIYSISTYNKVLKNTHVSDLFETAEFPFLGCKGIRKCYYAKKSLYEFYNYVFTRNLSIDINDPKSLIKNKVSSKNKAFIPRSEINKVTSVEVVYKDGDEQVHLKGSNGIDVVINAGVTLHSNINSNSILGFNNSKLYDSNSMDITERYILDEPIWINKEQSGTKTIYSISMNDGDANNPVVLPLNGSDEDIETDKLNWLTLLTALNNNKTIDLLESSLIKIKKDLKDHIIQEGQNISDIYSIEDDERTVTKANAHDNVWDESSEHYKEKNAEFDKDHNLYNFNYGYGYSSGGESSNNEDVRDLKNRGVIVFVIEGGSVNRMTYGQSDPNKFAYNLKEGDIRTKRMYISKDGVICTKEYYDRESSSDGFKSNPQTSINDLQSKVIQLEAAIKTLNNLPNVINDLKSELSSTNTRLSKLESAVSEANKIINVRISALEERISKLESK